MNTDDTGNTKDEATADTENTETPTINNPDVKPEEDEEPEENNYIIADAVAAANTDTKNTEIRNNEELEEDEETETETETKFTKEINNMTKDMLFGTPDNSKLENVATAISKTTKAIADENIADNATPNTTEDMLEVNCETIAEAYELMDDFDNDIEFELMDEFDSDYVFQAANTSNNELLHELDATDRFDAYNADELMHKFDEMDDNGIAISKTHAKTQKKKK